jgi:hypothetical protein
MKKDELIATGGKRRIPAFMTLTDIFSKNSILKRYYFKTVLVIGIVWTCFDYTRFLTLSFTEKTTEYPKACPGYYRLLCDGLFADLPDKR